MIPDRSRIVCTVTGHGLKDPEVVASKIRFGDPLAPNESAVRRALEQSEG